MAEKGLTDIQIAFVRRFILDVDRGAASKKETPATGNISIMNLGKARIEWIQLRTVALNGIQSLKSVVRDVYSPYPDVQQQVEAALSKVDAAISRLNEDLHAQLDDVLNEEDPTRRATLAQKASGTAKVFFEFCDKDPVLSSIDGNEFAPDTSIIAPMRAKLQDILSAIGV